MISHSSVRRSGSNTSQHHWLVCLHSCKLVAVAVFSGISERNREYFDTLDFRRGLQEVQQVQHLQKELEELKSLSENQKTTLEIPEKRLHKVEERPQTVINQVSEMVLDRQH